MPRFRRNFIQGGTYFFTVNLNDRNSNLLVRYVDQLRLADKKTKNKRPFDIHAWVVLPEHMHCVWTLPEGDADYAGRWRAIKTALSKAVSANTTTGSIWQGRYWEHTIRSDADYAAHVDYVHINPLKHGYVTRVIDWPHSSFHKYVANGTYGPDWAGGSEGVIEHGAGER